MDNFGYVDPATKLVPKAKLTPETAVYWSNLAKYLYDEAEANGVADASVHLDGVKPELSGFTKYLREYIFDFVRQKRKKELERKRKSQDSEAAAAPEDEDDTEAEEVAWIFVCKQLVEMTSVFDLSDEVKRN